MGGFLSTAIPIASQMHDMRMQGATRQQYLQPLQQHIQPQTSTQPIQSAQPPKSPVPPLDLASLKRPTYGRGDESPNKFMLALIIVAIVFIILFLFLRSSPYFGNNQYKSEQLVTNSPQILSHEDVELREYSQYVPKLQLPYMFF